MLPFGCSSVSIGAVFTQFFADIHDQRQSEKIHYAFYDVLFLTVYAVIGVAERWEEIEDFGEIHLPRFQSKALLTKSGTFSASGDLII